MKKEGMAEWGVVSKILPQGEGQSTIFFWDVYNSLNGAFKHMMNQAILSDLDPAKFGEFFERKSMDICRNVRQILHVLHVNEIFVYDVVNL